MKHAIKLNGLVTFLLFCSISISSFSQTLKDVFNNSESPLLYLGIEFSKARLLGDGNADDIRNHQYGSINQLIINEPKKYDLKGAFNKSSMNNDLNPVSKSNEKAIVNEIISTNPEDFSRFKESDIASIVKGMDLSGKKGVGLLFVLEAMRKSGKKGDVAIWVTFVDMATNKVLMTERIVSETSSAIGFRNYWASAIKNLIDMIDKKKFKEWQAKYSS